MCPPNSARCRPNLVEPGPCAPKFHRVRSTPRANLGGHRAKCVRLPDQVGGRSGPDSAHVRAKFARFRQSSQKSGQCRPSSTKFGANWTQVGPCVRQIVARVRHLLAETGPNSAQVPPSLVVPSRLFAKGCLWLTLCNEACLTSAHLLLESYSGGGSASETSSRKPLSNHAALWTTEARKSLQDYSKAASRNTVGVGLSGRPQTSAEAGQIILEIDQISTDVDQILSSDTVQTCSAKSSQHWQRFGRTSTTSGQLGRNRRRASDNYSDYAPGDAFRVTLECFSRKSVQRPARGGEYFLSIVGKDLLGFSNALLARGFRGNCRIRDFGVACLAGQG